LAGVCRSGRISKQVSILLLGALQESRAPSTASSPPRFAAGGKLNLRRHFGTRLTFTACVRLSATSEEIVECENGSKGGLCFHSRKRYEANAFIEASFLYYPGQPSVFVRARVVRVEELPRLNLFRCGVSYS